MSRRKKTGELPEISLGVRRDVDGTTHIRTGARGELGIFAWIILIVVAGFVAVFVVFAMATRAQREEVRWQFFDRAPGTPLLPRSLPDADGAELFDE